MDFFIRKQWKFDRNLAVKFILFSKNSLMEAFLQYGIEHLGLKKSYGQKQKL